MIIKLILNCYVILTTYLGDFTNSTIMTSNNITTPQPSVFETIIALQMMKNETSHTPQKILVLFHTNGEYEDDWIPMTPIPNGSGGFCWNGQKFHRDDHLLGTYGKYTIILGREKKNRPYKFEGIVLGSIVHEDGEELVPKGTARKYKILGFETTTSFNGIDTNTSLTSGTLPPQKAALESLGLVRIGGGYMSGIQLCKRK